MRARVSKLLRSVFVVGLFAPVFIAVPAFAAVSPTRLLCQTTEVQIEAEVSIPNPNICDMSVDKQVSVNGSAFIEANTSDTAASAHVGDTIIWKITITNETPGIIAPHGYLYVQDVLPTGIQFDSSSATAGNYIGNDGSYFQNNWALPLLDDSSVTTLPATLTFTTTATTTGLIQNTASLSKFDDGHCDGGCTYLDEVDTNNTNSAFVNIIGKSQVLGESTTTPAVLGDTGQAIPQAILIAGSILSSAGLAILLTRRIRKTNI